MSKIVIIDDNTLIAKLYEANLEAEGHEVKVAFDGASGFELVIEYKPDIILLDLMMPEMSGVEIIKELRADAAFANTPILAYSGGDDEVLEAAREAGASSIISKKESSLKKIIEHLNELLVPPGERQIVPFHNQDQTDDEIEDSMRKLEISNQRILIVEDDNLIVTIIKNIVESIGYQTVIAADGREAYRILAKDADFAAGIFDVHIPFIKGTDLLRHMRTEKRLMKIPVMMITTEETVRIQLDSLSAGAAVFLQKPFERKTFEALFRSLVSQ